MIRDLIIDIFNSKRIFFGIEGPLWKFKWSNLKILMTFMSLKSNLKLVMGNVFDAEEVKWTTLSRV